VVSTIAGTAGVTGTADGTGAAARLYNPAGIDVDSAGNIRFLAHGRRLVRRRSPAFVQAFARPWAWSPSEKLSTNFGSKHDDTCN